ncbi:MULTISPECIES: hypothetical protein [Mycobacteriaceae]|uniref:Uncharacterized protein n=2 Tax=Mycobacteriaceae TaxID=1762 RepID=A0A1S1JS07_9MYCO|nr:MULTISPECIES: hypothetical protein [Mycobacteriaceae]MBP2451863.1 hypothetical protein [Mycolicibacterium lutetiense]OHT92483.1 hypothetical protein BKG61_24355 [Mycobacterium syngnathidarum]OLT94431.1 hypothetical protein BKG60_19360 [Mycobacterium syngnathidarum]
MRAFIDANSIIVTEGDDTVMVGSADPAYQNVRTYLVDDHGQDFATVKSLVEVVRVTVRAAVAEAVSVVDGNDDDADDAYRVTHGDPVAETVLSTALRLARETADMAPLGAFLRRLERNPSAASRSQLFGWLKAGGFVLTTDGLIVGYKSVRNDGFSAHAGREAVTVVHQDGTSETITGNIPYPVGATVWMDRDLVNPDRHSACSVGLHVGTYNYASDFSEQMLVVLVDPADVVSVPADHNAQKMRVCRLTVAARHDGEQISDAVIEHIRTVPDFEASDEYARREGNKPRPTFGVVVSFGDSDDELDSDHEDHEGDEQQGDQRCDEYAGGDEDEIVVPLGETPCMPDQWSL